MLIHYHPNLCTTQLWSSVVWLVLPTFDGEHRKVRALAGRISFVCISFYKAHWFPPPHPSDCVGRCVSPVPHGLHLKELSSIVTTVVAWYSQRRSQFWPSILTTLVRHYWVLFQKDYNSPGSTLRVCNVCDLRFRT